MSGAPWFYILWVYGFVCFATGVAVAIFDLHGGIGTLVITASTVAVLAIGRRRKA